MRYKQENSKFFVSGTVLSPNMNGSLPLSGGRSRAKYRTPKSEELGATVSLQPLDSGTIFPGTPGALATKSGQCELSSDLVAPLLDNNMPLERIAQLAFMFNFHEGPVMAIGRQQLCVQLGDGTGETQYESDWSRGFSLDSVGISQIIAYVYDCHYAHSTVRFLTMVFSIHEVCIARTEEHSS